MILFSRGLGHNATNWIWAKIWTDLQFYLDLFPFGYYLLMPPCAEMQIKDWDFHDEFSDQYILGIVPKSDGVTWRLISHLSYSTFNGINDFIYPVHCTVRYPSPDRVVKMMKKLGKRDASVCWNADKRLGLSRWILGPVYFNRKPFEKTSLNSCATSLSG
jgi:hypothetical protein